MSFPKGEVLREKKLGSVAMACLLVVLSAEMATTKADDPHMVPPEALETDRPGWLGFGFNYRDDAEAPPTKPRGFFWVRGVDPGGPADGADIRKQDLIAEINGEAFHFESDLAVLEFFAQVKVGDSIELTIIRGSESMTLKLVAVVMPDEKFERWKRIYATAKAQAAF